MNPDGKRNVTFDEGPDDIFFSMPIESPAKQSRRSRCHRCRYTTDPFWYTQRELEQFRMESEDDRSFKRWIQKQNLKNRIEVAWRSSTIHKRTKGHRKYRSHRGPKQKLAFRHKEQNIMSKDERIRRANQQSPRTSMPAPIY